MNSARPRSRLFLFLFLLQVSWNGSARGNAHPQVLVEDSDRAAIQAKVQNSPWAHQAYQTLKSEIDQDILLTQTDPHFFSSRLFMNWSTHDTLPITEKERWIGGSGHAPVPTPRFAGARDWATPYTMPPKLEDYKPYNDLAGKVWMINSKTHQGEWSIPGRRAGPWS